ncbi:hypothetical protein DW228_06320 [Bacteroides fragilis]|uniref:Uncharacterized protein n=1 Tax=Bacteroides fragilis TaxID=817 RepID=A0A396C6R3_BACFG|nr:hypothetical protein [Bacteroides fragilis]RHH14412.1 hypothetical protein DW228_06320 [Bacteroides fragilis]
MSEFYTDEERKEEWTFECDHFIFKTCRDLSCGVNIILKQTDTTYPVQELINILAQETSRFTFYWAFYHRSKLNDFNGLDTVNWNCKLS